jgi:glycerophosphoryl diester phosphodiesterase
MAATDSGSGVVTTGIRAGLDQAGPAAAALAAVVSAGRGAGSGASWMAMNYRYARPAVLRRCAAAGRRVMVWTVNDDRRLDRFLGGPRVAVVVTDRPEHAVAVRARAVTLGPPPWSGGRYEGQ